MRLCSSLREFRYIVVIDTNPLDLVMKVASIILPFSYEEKGREESRERGEIKQNFIIDCP